jgi:biopolymer transport protein ExbD
MRLSKNPNDGSVGFQIAPMIDVVFVIMLFFMVMAGAVKVENELNTKLPGSAETSNSVDFVDEQIITIAENGEVALNEEVLDNATDTVMPQLTGTLKRLKESSVASKSLLAVTIASEPLAKYGRAIDVLNALAAAEIGNVTFTVSEEE